MSLLHHAYRHTPPRNLLVSLRHLCTAQADTTTGAKPSPDDIMNISANKATRFVYLRTLPLRKQPELVDQVDAIAERIEHATKSLCEKHRNAIVDDRSAVHLHTAALAIASHRVLAPRIKNEIRLSNIIRAGFGAVLLPEGGGEAVQSEKGRPDYWIVKTALWFAWDKMNAVRSMTRNMVRDFGGGFDTQVVDGGEGGEHTLYVRKCMYNDICREEGLAHLTRVFCALDRSIYSPITVQSHGIQFELDKTLADAPAEGEETNAETACEFKFTKVSGRHMCNCFVALMPRFEGSERPDDLIVLGDDCTLHSCGECWETSAITAMQFETSRRHVTSASLHKE